MPVENTIDDVNYGPLAVLDGTWKGDSGIDIAPEPEGPENNPYFETIQFEKIGDVTNAESQTLAAVFYRQIVKRHSTGKIFHDQCGYWMWDAETNRIMQSLTIPRAVSVLAGGTYEAIAGDPAHIRFSVHAAHDNRDWGITESPFMQKNARTLSFEHTLTVSGEKLVYAETTVLDIYGRRFDHTDENTLMRSP